MCNSKKSKFIKDQEASGLFRSLGIKRHLSKIPALEFVLKFLLWFRGINKLIQDIKLNEIAHKFLLAGDKFRHEMHLRQPGFTYSACGPFTKNIERIQ